MKKELLFTITKKDFDISYFSGTGAGGQHRNKSQNCVRIKHRDSGVTTTGQNHRSLEQNKKDAFLRLTKHPDFKKWHRIECAHRNIDIEEEKKQIEREVNTQMQEKNLKVEYFDPEVKNG